MAMQSIFVGEGNLGNNPTLKYVPVGDGQKAVVEFDVKFNFQKFNKNNGNYEDNGGFWGRVSLWGKRAEYLNKLLVKGCRVVVVGEYSQTPYIATKGEYEGQERISNEINATHVGLSLLGIESIQFEKRNASAQNPQSTQGQDSYPEAQDFNSESPVPVE